MVDNYNEVRAETFALLADAVVCTDENGRILFFNRVAEESFGYNASEVTGQHLNMLLPDRFRAQHSSQMESFGSGRGAAKRLMGRERIVWGLRKNGEEFPVEATISRDLVDGETVMTVVHRDVTERQRLEDHGIKLSDATIYRKLKRSGLNRLPRGTRLRKVYTKRYNKQVPTHHIQMDVKLLTFIGKKGENIRRFQYIAIDDATRVRALKVYQEVYSG